MRRVANFEQHVFADPRRSDDVMGHERRLVAAAACPIVRGGSEEAGGFRARHRPRRSGGNAITNQLLVICVGPDQIPGQHPLIGAFKLFFGVRRRVDVTQPR
jgi:hypothetical protein